MAEENEHANKWTDGRTNGYVWHIVCFSFACMQIIENASVNNLLLLNGLYNSYTVQKNCDPNTYLTARYILEIKRTDTNRERPLTNE